MQTLTKFVLLLAFFLFSHSLFSQSFSEYLAAEGKDNRSFAEMQVAFHEWSQTVDISKEKGWKAWKRWADFNERRTYGDGTLAGPAVYHQAAFEVAQQKHAQQMAKTTGAGNWVPIGPDVLPSAVGTSMIPGIGRMNCITFHPTDMNTFWVGVAQGGIWKTTDGGTSWMPLNNNLPILRISDIAVNPVDPDTMYISVGDFEYIDWWLEPNDKPRQTHFGLGVYKTTDGGMTWSPTGLSVDLTDKDYSLTRKVLIHPDRRDHLVAAGTYGVRKSFDGGASWTAIHDSLMMDLEADPSDPEVLYATSGWVIGQNIGGASIMKSTDFGDTWNVLPTGIPVTGSVMRIEVEVAPSDPDYVYAITVNTSRGMGAILRSTNAGASWSTRSTSPNVLASGTGGSSGGQGVYDLAFMVHPTNKEHIYAGGINIWGSHTGGSTWERVSNWTTSDGPSLHADQHQFNYNPLSDKFYVMNDGGIYSTDTIILGYSGGEWATTWDNHNAGIQTTSFYRMDISPNDPGYYIAGAQDNATWYFDKTEWLLLIGGDGMDCMLDPDDGTKLWGSSQYGNYRYSANGGSSTSFVSPPVFEEAEWTAPMEMNPINSNTIYVGEGNLHKSTDRGLSGWQQLSNFSIIPTSGNPSPISHFSIAPSDTNVIYVAQRVYYGYNEPARFWVTSNEGTTWTDITAGLPDSLYYNRVEVDSDDPNTAWVVCGGHVDGVKVFETNNMGSSWTNISGTLPNISINSIVHDSLSPNNPLYIGTDVGVYYRDDLLSDWTLYSSDLPNVIVSDLEIDPVLGELYCATFGRGLWMVELRDSLLTNDTKLVGEEMGMTVFPNPNSGAFSVRLTDIDMTSAQMKIVNVLGATVYSQPLTFASKAVDKAFDLNLTSGVYWLVLEGEGKRRSRRFTIQ